MDHYCKQATSCICLYLRCLAEELGSLVGRMMCSERNSCLVMGGRRNCVSAEFIWGRGSILKTDELAHWLANQSILKATGGGDNGMIDDLECRINRDRV